MVASVLPTAAIASSVQLDSESGSSTVKIQDQETGEYYDAEMSWSTNEEPVEADVELPSEYYLNNLGYITPAKIQSPWGTCWAFAVAAAVESSILKASAKLNGVAEEASMETPVLSGLNDSIDISERAIAWFAHEAQSEASGGSQAGEGFVQNADASMLAQFESGSFSMVSAALAARQNLVLEESVPYRYNGYDGSGPAFYHGSSYAGSSNDARMRDWSVEDAYRTSNEVGWYVTDIVNIADPAILDVDVSTGQAYYAGYDPSATVDIKRALTDIGGVAISIQADLSVPAEIASGSSEYDEHGSTINYGTWSQYNGSDVVELNHAVTIVGWDDEYPVSAFGSSDGGVPDAPGAWLCKNNWGSDALFQSLGDPDSSLHWGIRTNDANGDESASGFFWLSYYDHSIAEPVAFEVAPIVDENVYQYDFLSTAEYEFPAIYSGEVQVANVFTANDVELLESIGCWTFSGGETVKTWIYSLPNVEEETDKVDLSKSHPVAAFGNVSAVSDSNDGVLSTGDDFKDALDGATLLVEKEESYELAGYHTMKLDEPILLFSGERFAIVQQIDTVSADSEGNLVTSTYLALEISFLDYVALNSLSSRSNVVANEGESFVSVNGASDWSSIDEYNHWYSTMKEYSGETADMVFGNALIKAISKDTSMGNDDRIYEVKQLQDASEDNR